MSSPADFTPRAIAVFCFREEDYPTVVAIFEDGDKMPSRWEEWEQSAQRTEKDLQSLGHVVERVYIDPDTFADWCGAKGVRINTKNCEEFAAEITREKYGRDHA